MWNVKANLIPVKIGANGTIPKSFRKHLSNITHTAERVYVKVQNIFHGRNNITCSTDCKYTTAAIIIYPGNVVFSDIYCKYPVKGDNKDKNNNTIKLEQLGKSCQNKQARIGALNLESSWIV